MVDVGNRERHLCAWGNDAANEVITEARQLLVENYFQTPSSALGFPLGCREFLEGFPYGNNPTISKFTSFYMVFADFLTYLYSIINEICKKS